LEGRLSAKLEKELPVSPKLYLEILQRLGFAPAREDLYPRLLAFYSSQVLGFYEPSSDTMVVVERPLPGDQDPALLWAHELAHAAQEKRFRLPSRLLSMKSNSDQQRAFSAIAEGEAMLVMLALAPEGALSAAKARELAQAIASGTRALAQNAGIGEFFVEDLAFPYAQGLTTVLAAWEAKGWQGVDALLAQPPQCTAALLFASPCHHLSDDLLPPIPAQAKLLLADTLGAWALQFWLGQKLSREEATAIARLWDGDRFHLVQLGPDRRHWALAWALHLPQEENLPVVEKALRQALPTLLAGLTPGQAPHFLYRTQGRVLTVLVNWPEAQP
jgi:hypothetical protein